MWRARIVARCSCDRQTADLEGVAVCLTPLPGQRVGLK